MRVWAAMRAGRRPTAPQIARFDAITTQEVDSAREWLRLDPFYRSALAALGQDHGQPTF